MPNNHPAFEHLAMAASDGVDEDVCLGGDDRERDPIAGAAKLTEAAARGWHTELFCDEHIVVYTDGACTHNQDQRIRRAGCGAFWSVGHSNNISCS